MKRIISRMNVSPKSLKALQQFVSEPARKQLRSFLNYRKRANNERKANKRGRVREFNKRKPGRPAGSASTGGKDTKRSDLHYSVGLKRTYELVPQEQRARAIDYVLRKVPLTEREHIRSLPFVQQERFLATRDALNVLSAERYNFWSSVEARTGYGVSINNMTRLNHLFAYNLTPEGRYQRARLLPPPRPRKESRALGIKGPLPLPRPFLDPKELARESKDIMDKYDLSVSVDGKGASLDPFVMMTELFDFLRRMGNLREPGALLKNGKRSVVKYLRAQAMGDAFRFTSHGMAVRFGIRSPDALKLRNAPMFFRNVSFYRGVDKDRYLGQYLGECFDKMNRHCKLTFTAMPDNILSWEWPDEYRVSAEILMPVAVKGTNETEVVEITTGGDAAFNADMHRTQSVAVKGGACLLCLAEKGGDWFNVDACEKALRRNAWDDVTSSHTDPFEHFSALGVTIPQWVRDLGHASCRCCGEELTPEFIESEEKAVTAMSHSARVEWERLRKLAHDGKGWRRVKFLMVDHCKMHLSQLHHLLNSVGTNLAVTLAAKAGKSMPMRAQFNSVLEAGHFWFRFKEPGVTGVDQRPTGPECRRLLIGGGRNSPKTLQLLLAVAYRDDTNHAPSNELLAELSALTSLQNEGVQAGLHKAPPQSKAKKPAAKPKVRKVSGVSAGVKLPRQARAATTTTAEDESDSDSNAGTEADVLDDEDPDSALPSTPTEVVGNYASAVKCWATLIKLQLQLHAEWDDHDPDERRRWGAKFKESGRDWVTTVRKHVNNKIFYFYLHLSFAHLEEITIENGHPSSGDDSILEQGNQIGKKHGRTSVYWGGTSASDSTTSVLKFTKYKKSDDGAEDEFKGYEVTKANNKGVAEQMVQLQQLRSLADERRATGETSHSQPVTGNAVSKEVRLQRNMAACHFLSKAREKGMQVKREMDAAANRQISYDLEREADVTR